MPGINIEINGVSDVSDYVTRGLNFVGNTALNRVFSGTQKLLGIPSLLSLAIGQGLGVVPSSLDL